MAGRKLIVEIVGDASSLSRTLDQAGRNTRTFEGRVSGLHSSLGTLAKTLIGGGGVVYAFNKIVDAAKEAEVSQRLSAVAVKDAGLSYQQHRGEIEKTLSAQMKLTAFNDEDLRDSFSRIVRATGDVSEALKLNALSADIARGRNIDLESSTQIVIKAQLGMVGQLRRLGIELQPVTAAQDALRASTDHATQSQIAAAKALDLAATKQTAIAQLQEKYKGAAESYGNTSAGAADKFRNSIDELEESIGRALLPTLSQILVPAAAWAQRMADSGKAQREVKDAITEATPVFKTLKTVLETIRDALVIVNRATGGLKNTLELLLALKVVSVLSGWTRSFTALAGTEAAAGAGTGMLGAAGVGSRLLSILTKLSRIGLIAITIDILFPGLKEKVGGWFHAIFDPIDKAVGGAAQAIFGTDLGVTPKSAPKTTGTLAAGVGLAVPTRFHATHETANLPGFPAVDIMAKAGTKVLAPENGRITRTTGGSPALTPAAFKGYSLYYVGEETGTTYFMTHLASVAPIGRYLKGDIIATLAAGTQGGSHLHVGQAQGAPSVAFAPSTSSPPTPGSAGATPTGISRQPIGLGGTSSNIPPPSGTGLTTTKATSFELPIKYQTALAEAGLTKTTADDLKALKAAEKYVDALIPSLKGEKKLAALRELKSLRDDMQNIEDAAAAAAKTKRDAEQARQKAALKKHMDALRDIVANKRGVFEDAFADVANKAFAAFDRETQKYLTQFDAETQRLMGALQDQFAVETPEERALREFQAAKTDEQRKQARDEANAIEDGNERVARLRELDLQDQEQSLQDAADASRRAKNAELAKAVSALEEQRAAQRTSYEDQRADQRTALQAWLDDQEKALETGGMNWATFYTELLKVSGVTADGLASDAARAKQAWIEMQAAQTNMAAPSFAPPPSATVPKLTQAQWDYIRNSGSYEYLNPGIPLMAGGGIVRKPLLAMIGESGPEAIVPLNQYSGKQTGEVHFHFDRYLGSRDELMREMSSEFNRYLRRNGVPVGGSY